MCATVISTVLEVYILLLSVSKANHHNTPWLHIPTTFYGVGF